MTYPGGKNGPGIYQVIINKMPPHDTYIEGFLGSGAIMRHKKLAGTNIGIDLDPAALEHFADLIAINNDERSGADYTILNIDTIEFLRNYKPADRTMIYLDPPYLHETRSKTKIYKHEMTDDQHMELLEIIKNLECMVMISGYYSDMYHKALEKWSLTNFLAMTRRGIRTEYLWHNYDIPPTNLHDYSFLGHNFRERERISRRKIRWINRLGKLPPHEREALLAVIREEFPEGTS